MDKIIYASVVVAIIIAVYNYYTYTNSIAKLSSLVELKTMDVELLYERVRQVYADNKRQHGEIAALKDKLLEKTSELNILQDRLSNMSDSDTVQRLVLHAKNTVFMVDDFILSVYTGDNTEVLIMFKNLRNALIDMIKHKTAFLCGDDSLVVLKAILDNLTLDAKIQICNPSQTKRMAMVLTLFYANLLGYQNIGLITPSEPPYDENIRFGYVTDGPRFEGSNEEKFMMGITTSLEKVIQSLMGSVCMNGFLQPDKVLALADAIKPQLCTNAPVASQKSMDLMLGPFSKILA